VTLTLKPTPSDSFLAALSAAQNAAGVARGAYCLGLGLPFVALAVAFSRTAGALGWVKRNYH